MTAGVETAKKAQVGRGKLGGCRSLNLKVQKGHRIAPNELWDACDIWFEYQT